MVTAVARWRTALAGVAYVVTAGILLIPEAVPEGFRFLLVLPLTVISLAIGGVCLWHSTVGRLAMVVLLAAVCISVVVEPPQTPEALRHFSGIGLGFLTAGVIVRVCVSERLLVACAALGCLAAAGIVFLGLVGLADPHGPYDPWAIPEKARRILLLLPSVLTTWIPHQQLGVPGLAPHGGYVNVNALGAAAAAALPLGLTLVGAGEPVAARKTTRVMTMALAVATVMLATLALVVSQSRSAIVAAALCVLLGIFFSSGVGGFSRRYAWIAVGAGGLVVLVGVAVVGLGIAELQGSLGTRWDLWKVALDRLAESPWTGVGINRFRELTTAEHPGVPHAHNMFLQVALDVGVAGAVAYSVWIGALIADGLRMRAASGLVRSVGRWAALSVLAIHVFGVTDAVALGAKIGILQWVAIGLVVASSQLRSAPSHH